MDARSSCILLDIRIPELSGPELQARLNDMGSHLPIIFLAAHGDISTTVQVIRAGAEDSRNVPGCGGSTAMTVGLMGKLRILRHHPDWLLTLLTAVLALMIFVFAPLQAAGIFLFQTFAIAGLLLIITAALVISGNPVALALMVIAFVANLTVFFLRIYYPWPYNLTLLAAAWLIIAVTLGVVVAQAVFRSGRITYHRIISAILLYLLIAVTFATLFAFVGLSISHSFKGIAFEDDAALASSLFYLSFVTLSSTGYGDIVPLHPLARSLCNIESIIGQLYPATILARLVTLELETR
jgi:CheY-like chemotaxis protein